MSQAMHVPANTPLIKDIAIDMPCSADKQPHKQYGQASSIAYGPEVLCTIAANGFMA
jgi:hypothetical protein